MNRRTRPISHGRMGQGNNRCSRVIVRVLAESLLGAVKSKANRDVTIRLDCHWHCCFYSFSAQNSGQICLKSWKWQLEYGHSSMSQLRISILSSTARVQVTKKCHENSGGYALCLLYIVMCAILRVVAYFLSVNLLHMYTVFVALCVTYFSLKE